MPERLSYKTVDDVQIVADWVTSPTTAGAVILLHAFPLARQSWAAFQRALALRGLASLAIDLRGHGESVRGPDGRTLDYKKFTDGEHLSSIEDVRGAFAWLRARGIEPERIAVVGASIGANLALRFLAEEPMVPAAALLSPGENYHGVTTLDIAEEVLPHQSVWMAASSVDDEESVRAMAALTPLFTLDRLAVEKLEGAGHGTKMLESKPALMDSLADWLRERILAVG
jgi:pimeloyl-ACP methyl ester carboxylesterase